MVRYYMCMLSVEFETIALFYCLQFVKIILMYYQELDNLPRNT